MGPSVTLLEAAKVLAKLYPPEPAPTDPFEIVVWENIAYLADDDQRRAAFDTLRDRIGLGAAAIAKAPLAKLEAIARLGGIHADQRAARLKDAAQFIVDECGGDLDAALRPMPLAKARALVKKLPAIGDPGADRILLTMGLAIAPALDSNGLRVITRLGFSPEEKAYAATYKAACKAILDQGKRDRAWLIRLDQSARAHGKTICRRTAPGCLACPLQSGCAYARTKA